MKNSKTKSSKKSVNNSVEKEVRPRYQSLKSKIVVLLTERRDLTRYALAEVLDKPQQTVDIALCHLRKLGYHIFPIKGPGTPLRIAGSASEAMKFINWRRSRLLGTARQMVIDEAELGGTFEELSGSKQDLLKILNSTTYENSQRTKLPAGANSEVKTGQRATKKVS